MATKNASPVVVNRPKQVEYAIKLLLTSLVFGVLVGYINNSRSAEGDYFLIYTYIIILGLLFNGFFVYKISQNRNWARKLFIIFTLISLIFYVPQLASSILTTPFNALLQLANILIQLVAVYFLMQKESKEWFLLVNSKNH